MPNCSNEITKTVKNSGIFYGVHIESAELGVCDNHPINEVQDILNELCKNQCINSQICNPFVDSESLRKKRSSSK